LGWRNYLPPEPLSHEEEADLERAKRRMWALCRACEGAELPLLVDAEYTSVQPAIDYLTYNAAMHFNSSAKKKNPKENLKKENLEKDEKPLVYGTVQAYLVDAFPRLRLAAEAAAQRGVSFGVKLVRGAYLSREAALAASLSAPSPILPSIHDTHRNYDACAAYMLHRAASASHGAGSSCVVLATHNAHSGNAPSFPLPSPDASSFPF
jgi:proline dehydrogenase